MRTVSEAACVYGSTIAVVSAIAAFGTVLVYHGRSGSRLAEELDLQCVVGHRYRITNKFKMQSFPSYLVSRDDAGILCAKWILGDGATDQSATDLIRSQTITLGNWTARVTQNKLQVDPRIAGFPLWEYPVDVPDDQSGGHSSIAIVGQLPEGVDGRGPFATGTKYSYTGMGYCDSGSAEGNVWFEFRDWLPDALLAVGRANFMLALIVACTALCVCCVTTCPLRRAGLLPYFVHPVGQGAAILLMLTCAGCNSYSVAIGSKYSSRGMQSDRPQWEKDMFRKSPQTQQIGRMLHLSMGILFMVNLLYSLSVIFVFPCLWDARLQSMLPYDTDPNHASDPHGPANAHAQSPPYQLVGSVQVHPLAVEPGQGGRLDNSPMSAPGSGSNEARARSDSSQEISGDGTPLVA